MNEIEYRIGRAYDNLAKAIVYQAIRDYVKAYSDFIKKKPGKAKSMLAELRRFFTSRFYGMLFDYDGNALMEYIEQNCHDIKTLKHLKHAKKSEKLHMF